MLFRVLYYEEGMCKYTNLKKTKVYIKLEVFIHSVVYSLLSMFDSTKFHSVYAISSPNLVQWLPLECIY